MPDRFDWTHLQSFLAVAEQGSLSAAARSGAGSQPTMSRHVAALEARLGVRLFERVAGGLELTPTGLELLDHARAMADVAGRIALTAQGRTESIAGAIRITASEIVAVYVLPDILAALHREEPEIEIELVASDRTENLLQREADIAVRMYRPTQSDVFTRKVADLRLGMFAARSYVERRGAPRSREELRHHDVIGYDRSDLLIRGFQALGMDIDRSFFSFRCDNQIACWRMVVAGFGIGFNQIRIAAAEPEVVHLELDAELPVLPVWLTAHSELKTSRRVRRVFDFLAEHLRRHQS